MSCYDCDLKYAKYTSYLISPEDHWMNTFNKELALLMNEFMRLCAKYNLPTQYGNDGLDPVGTDFNTLLENYESYPGHTYLEDLLIDSAKRNTFLKDLSSEAVSDFTRFFVKIGPVKEISDAPTKDFDEYESPELVRLIHFEDWDLYLRYTYNQNSHGNVSFHGCAIKEVKPKEVQMVFYDAVR
jgi:hypothetical protein